MIALDTSGAVALVNRRDPNHLAAKEASTPGGLVAPALVLGEMAYMIGDRAGEPTLLRFLEGFEDGTTLLDCGDTDLPRVRELIQRYTDLRLGFADAAVIACAERIGGLVLTFDRRDFEVVAQDLPITLLP